MQPVNTLNRRQAIQTVAAGLLPAPFLAAAQTGYPNKAVRIVVPLPAGGAADVSARILAEVMQGPFGQAIAVDNRPGGAFSIGIQQLTSAAPDGSTLLHVNTTLCAIQAAFKRFDMTKQMVPVALMGSTDAVLVASPGAPFKTVQEMITWARANPGKLTSGNVGMGSLEHLIMVQLGNKAGFTTNQIPFKGGPDGALAVAQGEVMVMPMAAPLLVPFKDKVRPLASLAEKRNPLAPDVPTMHEIGLDVPPLSYWGGLMAPAGTPKAIVEVLQKHVAAALDSPALKARYAPLGITARYQPAEDMARVLENDLKWLGDAIKAAHLTFN